MSTEETPAGDPKKDKDSEFERESRKGPATTSGPAAERLFDFLDGLFAGEGNFPEIIDCREVHGRHYEVMGDPVKKHFYKGKDKPGKEDLLQLAHTLLLRIQEDCDVRRQETMYQVGAWHPSRSEDFYERILYRCKPKNTWKERGKELSRNGTSGSGPDGGDDELPFAIKYQTAFLEHSERSNELIHGMVMGLLDRSDKQAASYAEENAKLRLTVMSQFDVIQRLQSLADERESNRLWLDVKRKGTEKALEMGLTLAPVIVNKLAGKEVVPEQKNEHGIADSTTALVLRNVFQFLDTQPALLDLVAGRYDSDQKLTTPGIFSENQARLLYAIAQRQAPVEALDVILPGGQYAISDEQLQQLIALTQKGFPIEHLAALKTILDERLAERQRNPNGEKK